MAYEIPGKLVTQIAASDYSAAQYRGAALDTNEKAALPVNGGRIFGIVQNKPNVGFAATLMISGISKCEAGATFAVGTKLTVGSDGRCRLAASGENIFGVALQAAQTIGQFVAVEIDQMGILA
jgi:hypothetical protein